MFIILQASIVYNAKGWPRICVVDCGLKYNQLRCFLMRGARLDVVPWDHALNPEEFDGLFLSNGPGDPAVCGVTVDNIRKVMEQEQKKPIFGICLGHQLLATAAGCSTFKMK
jgi:carbamoyl-phosphate synthase/aspartate carbamoyltransferase/dihydroorotase